MCYCSYTAAVLIGSFQFVCFSSIRDSATVAYAEMPAKDFFVFAALMCSIVYFFLAQKSTMMVLWQNNLCSILYLDL